MGKLSNSLDDVYFGQSLRSFTDKAIVGFGESPEPPQAPMRKYLPTCAELIDRLSIVLMKAIFIGENREGYLGEIALIEHDINVELNRWHAQGHNFTAYDLRMVLMIMLANRWIWENEATIRSLEDGGTGYTVEDAERLRATHSINGVRNLAKNNLSVVFGERKDLKLDCLAADLPEDMGNWNVFG